MKKLRFLRPPGFWAEYREKIRHLRLRGAVGAYADGELNCADRARMATHIACCWSCSGSLETLKLIKASVRGSQKRAPASLASARLHRYAHQLAAAPATGPGSGTGKDTKRGRGEDEEGP